MSGGNSECYFVACLKDWTQGGMVSELLEAVEEVGGWGCGGAGGAGGGIPEGLLIQRSSSARRSVWREPRMNHSLNFQQSVSNRDVCCRSEGRGRETVRKRERGGERQFTLRTPIGIVE